MKTIKIFHLKIIVFTAGKYCSILHRRVCVMKQGFLWDLEAEVKINYNTVVCDISETGTNEIQTELSSSPTRIIDRNCTSEIDANGTNVICKMRIIVFLT